MPRKDVLEGALIDAVFAANLDEVVSGSAPDVYQDAGRFFSQTYPSQGLRQMLDAVFGRLSGKRADEAPILRLETSLGGGKTHNLIALYHAACGELPAGDAGRFLEPDLLLDEVPAIGVFVGTSVGATSFPETAGITPHTVWGHLALKLADAAGYEDLRADDEALSAPGSNKLAKLLDRSERNLILIDELARYLETSSAQTVGGSTLSRQTVSFLMALMEAVAGRDDSCLVLTTTGMTDVFGEQTSEVVAALQGASDLVSRRARTLRPSEETDLPHILAARLFESVDRDLAEGVANAYAQAVEAAGDAGLPLPERLTSSAWRGEIRESFPFHPDLITVLDRRLATIPQFHRTRGALRLLARSVRGAWERGDAQSSALLHPYHLSLRDKDTVEELTSRLDRPRFENVVRADIFSDPGAAPSNAQAIDTGGSGSPLAERLATTVFLYSLTKDTPGVSEGGALGAVLAPGDDPNRLLKALEDLRERAWFMHDTAGGLRFTEEVTLKRIIAQHELEVTGSQIEQRAQELLQECFKPAAFQVHATWADAKVVDKSDRATLVLFHWNRFGESHGVEDATGAAPAFIRETWEKAPDGAIRQNRNRLVLLAPAAERFAPMQQAVRRLVALEALVEDAGALAHLDTEKREQAHKQRTEAAVLAHIAICSLMSVLYVPSGQPPRLEPTLLPVVTQASLKANQTQAIEDHLANDHKLLASGDPVPDPELVATKLGKQLESGIATQKVLDTFASRTDLPIVLDSGRVREMLRMGVLNGTWEYHDASQDSEGWATREHGSARSYRIAADTYLHAVGSAPKPDDASGGREDDTEIDFGGSKTPTPPGASTITADGATQYALDQLLVQAAEMPEVVVAGVAVSINENGPQAGTELDRLLACFTSPPPAGAALHVNATIVIQLAGETDSVRIVFLGSADEWQPLRQAVHSLTTSKAAGIDAEVVATFSMPVAVDDPLVHDLSDQAANVGPAKATVRLRLEPAK
ncbi:MAG: DUF499 domain-containing protein [Solirubrobacteraceae bacterium]|jgi:hypothetical protein